MQPNYVYLYLLLTGAAAGQCPRPTRGRMIASFSATVHNQISRKPCFAYWEAAKLNWSWEVFGKFWGRNMVPLNDRPFKLCGTGSPSGMDILSAGLHMPERSRQKMPFVTFHLLNGAPLQTAWQKTNHNYIESWKNTSYQHVYYTL